MQRSSMRRLVGGAAALMLIGATLLSSAGSAIAAPSPGTTRLIYVGSDPLFKANNFQLSFSGVSAGGSAVSTVYVKNIDNQTLTHVVLTFTEQQGTLTLNPVPFGPDASFCTSDGTTLTCNFGQMAAGLVRSFSIYVDATTAGTQPFAGKVVFNESNNTNGGNQQISDLTASVVVDATSCTTLKTFVAPGQAKQLTLGQSCGSLSTQGGLVIPARANGNIVVLSDTGPATGCGKNTPCIGDEIFASVNGGAPVTPYLTWVVFYSNATLGTTKPDRVSFLHDTTLINSIKNGGACANATAVNCQDPFQVSADGVTYFIRTPTNSTVRGL